MKLQWQTVALCGCFLIAGAALGRYSNILSAPHAGFATDATDADNTYKFINPLLFCKDQDISSYTNAVPSEMEQKLNDYLSSAISQGTVAEASVYYKDLNSGPWVLIDGDMQTVPASLLKVPTAMAIYKHAEDDAAFLQKTYSIDTANTVNATQYFPPAEMIAPGLNYTVEELVRFMLQDSDNAALYLLGQSLPEQEFKDSYSDLGISVPAEAAPGYTINAKTFASFFRVLFNASYLSRDVSEHLLSVLAQSGFSKGIRAGVPKGTVVANKFGEYTVSPSDLRLNDCGIIYRPQDPYILCVITRGTNFDKLAGVISDISSTVWNVLESHK